MSQSEADDLFRGLLESAPDAILGLNEGVIVFVNTQTERLFGYRREELLNQSVEMLLRDTHVAHRAGYSADPHTRPFGTGLDLVARRKDGSEFPAEVRVSFLRTEGGLIVTSTIRDVTALRDAEERLRRTGQFNDAVMANIVEGLYTLNAEGLVTYVNPAAERLFGWTRDELMGRKMHDVTHYQYPDGRPFPAEECAGLLVLRQGVTLANVEASFIRKDGTFFPVVYSSAPLKMADKVVGLVVVFRDVTESQRLHEVEKRARRMAEAAERAMNEFVAMLAHELRNPLAPIRNAVHILRLIDPGEPRLQQVRGIIDRQVAHMVHLLGDLLDVSRITRGKIMLTKTRLDLKAIVTQAAETVQQEVQQKAHHVRLDLPPDPLWIDGDPVRMRQVVGNLLSNAVKFTPPGGTISVEARRAGEEVMLGVRDTGIGLAPEALDRVFDLFAQEATTLDRQQGGLGVGLTLVRRLIEMHGGRVEARSPGPGRGSEFRVTLPAASLAQALEPVASGADPERRGGVRVLIVEDNADAADSLGTLLTLLGHEVEITADGPTAVRLATTVPPDVALVDIGLPGMDGYEVAKQLRAACPDVILVALTGYGREQDRRRALAAGFQHHVIKPADPEAINTLLLQLGRRSVAASEESPTTQRS